MTTPSRVDCSCGARFAVEADARSASCPGCGAAIAIGTPEHRVGAKLFDCTRCDARLPFSVMIKIRGELICRRCAAAKSTNPISKWGLGVAGVLALVAVSSLLTAWSLGAFDDAPNLQRESDVAELGPRSVDLQVDRRATVPPQRPAQVEDDAQRPDRQPEPPSVDPEPGRAVPADRTALLISTDDGRAVVHVDGVWRALDTSVAGVDAVRWVDVAPDGTVWITGDGAVARVGAESTQGFGVDDGVPAAAISHLFRDPTGRTWITSWGDGIAYRDAGRWQRVRSADGLCHDDANMIGFGWNDTIWIGTDAGVSVLRGLEFLSGQAVQQLADLNVKSLITDSEGRVFMGTTLGLLILHPNMTFKWLTPENGLPQKTPQALCIDSAARLWVGTWGGGVVRVVGTDGEYAIAPTDACREAGHVGRLTEDSAGNIWAASLSSGLWKCDSTGWTRVAVPLGFASARVVAALPVEVAKRLVRGGALETSIAPIAADRPPAEASGSAGSVTVRNAWSDRVHVQVAGSEAFWLDPGGERALDLATAKYQVRLGRVDGASIRSTFPAVGNATWRIGPGLADPAYPWVFLEPADERGDAPTERVATRVHNETIHEVSFCVGNAGAYRTLPPGAVAELELPPYAIPCVLTDPLGSESYQVIEAAVGSDFVVRTSRGSELVLVATAARSVSDPDPAGTESVAPLPGLTTDTAAGLVRTFGDGDVRELAFDHTGMALVASCAEDHLVAWSIADSSELWSRASSHARRILGSEASGGFWTVDHSGRDLRQWDPRTGRLLGGVRRPAMRSDAIGFSVDARVAVFAGVGGSIYRCGLVDGELGPRLGAPTSQGPLTRSVAANAAGTRAAEGLSDGTIRIWNLELGSAERTLEGHAGWVNALAFDPSGTHLVSGGGHFESGGVQSLGNRWGGAFVGGSVLLWTVGSRAPVELGRHQGPVTSVAFSRDGARAASAGYDGRVVVWDVAKGVQREVVEFERSRVSSVAFSVHADLLAWVRGGRAELWKLRQD